MNCHWNNRFSTTGCEPSLSGQLDSSGRLQHLHLSPQAHEGVPRLLLSVKSDVVEATDVNTTQLAFEPQYDRAP